MKHILFIFLVIPSLTFSQGVSKGASSLKLPHTPFVAATGEAFIADLSSINSIMLNPANLSSITTYEILFSHTEWIQDTRIELLSISSPFQFGNIALSIANTSVDDIEIREIPGEALGTFNFKSANFQLTYATPITDNILFGISSKYIYEKLYSDETTGFGFSSGLIYKTGIDNLDIAASISDIGKLSAYRNEEIDLPTLLRIGSTYSFDIDIINVRTAVAYSSELKISNQHFSIGFETNYDNLIQVRFGYQTGYEIKGFSAGIGLVYNIVHFDYALMPFTQEAGTGHIFSVRFSL